MEKKIRKSEFSNVLKIGQTIGKKTYSRDDFYYNFNGKKVLHLNALIWEAPSIYTDAQGKEHYGFVPGDEFYDEIITEFKSMPDRYRAGNIVRKSMPDSEYDVVITWYSEVKMISWIFNKCYEYAV